MHSRRSHSRFVIVVCALAASWNSVAVGQPSLPQNCNPTFILGAVSPTFDPCSIDPCASGLASNEVQPGSIARIFLAVANHDNTYAVQTAFAWPSDWQLLGQSWQCRPGQITLTVPGPSGGTLATAFACVQGPQTVVVGWLDMKVGSSGCLTQIESEFPFGSHIVNCEPDPHFRLTAHVSVANRGSVCVGAPGVDVCKPDTNWDDVTSASLAASKVNAGAWGDYDGDGDLDLHLARFFAANTLFRNDNGTLVEAPAPSSPGLESFSSAWGDYDNDGDLDLYVAKNGPNALFRNDGGSFVNVTQAPLDHPGQSFAVAWVDYDRDGRLDLFQAAADGGNRLFRNTLAGFVDTGFDLGASFAGAWGDYDNDGDQDLFTGSRLHRNNATGFSDVTPAVMFGVSGIASDWGDYDNDGDVDLFVGVDSSLPTQTNRLFRNNGSTGFSDATAAPIDAFGPNRGAVWFDYDNDGDLDLHLCRHDVPNKLFRNNGPSSRIAFTEVENACLSWPGTNQSAAIGDYDNDGKADMFLATIAEPQPNDPDFSRLFHNLGSSTPANHWLKVRLVGMTSNRSGIGARIRVVATLTAGGAPTTQIRDVTGGGGYLAQHSLEAEFGLRAAAVASLVEVKWPSGFVSTQTAIGANQIVTIAEPSGDAGLTARVETLAGRVTGGSHPMCRIAFRMESAGPVRCRVFDVTGRHVRTLLDGVRQDAGERSVTWDGTSDRGAAVASGVYLYRIEAGARHQAGRVVLVR